MSFTLILEPQAVWQFIPGPDGCTGSGNGQNGVVTGRPLSQGIAASYLVAMEFPAPPHPELITAAHVKFTETFAHAATRDCGGNPCDNAQGVDNEHWSAAVSVGATGVYGPGEPASGVEIDVDLSVTFPDLATIDYPLISGTFNIVQEAGVAPCQCLNDTPLYDVLDITGFRLVLTYSSQPPSQQISTFTVNGSRIYEGPGRFCFNWYQPAPGEETIVDGSAPPRLVSPTLIPVFENSREYFEDDQFTDSNGNTQAVVAPGVSQPSSTPAWSQALFGITVDASGVAYVCLGAPGVWLGASNGALKVEIQDDALDLVPDQSRTAIRRNAMASRASITVELFQSELDLIAKALAAASYSAKTNTLYPAGAQTIEKMTGGGARSRFVPKVCVVAVMQQPGWSNPTKSHIVTLYAASVGRQPLQWAAAMRKPTTYAVRFDGMGVLSRPEDDQLYQWVRQI